MTDTPLEMPTMDYASLRQAGLRHLERLAWPEWTDFNEHDPGITILEQYCYALTELAYRCDFPLPDLLSREGKDAYASLPGPARILATRPVSLLDLRKLAVDVRGVKNAWIEKAEPSALGVFYNEQGQDLQEKLIQLADGEGAGPVALKGLYRVLIETSEGLGVGSAEAISEVARRLHAHRPLCMDFESVQVMNTQNIQVKASIEIDPTGKPDDIYVAILDKIDALLSPSVTFYTLAERRAAGLRVDEIFDGPPLQQGFIDSAELLRLERKTALRVSDFIHALMEVEGVLMVKHLVLSGDGGKQWEDWWLDLAATTPPVKPALDLDVKNSLSLIKLERRQIEVGVNYDSAIKRREQAQAKQAYRLADAKDLDILPPAGRDRRVARYYSAQHQFPAVYGLGVVGLPAQADARRQAQLRQLQAYLLFFDQLLANQFAQLAHFGDLLGFDEDNGQTYCAAEIDDPSLGLDAVWQQQNAKARRDRLSRIVENPAADDATPSIDWARKNRLLDHLLARYAEQFTDYAPFWQASAAGAGEGRLARDKQAWLRRYPELSAGRGTGFNVLEPWNKGPDPALDNCSGLEHRLRLKLGLPPEAGRFYVVEHVLLRPFDTDKKQGGPLLADACGADPYSLQISVVFNGAAKNVPEGGGFRRYIEQSIREEAPAHVLVRVCWLGKPGFAAFEDVHQTWRQSQRVLREANDQKGLNPALDNDDTIRQSFKLRDARDRLIDLLAIGHSYPLADLRVIYPKTVAWDTAGQITLLNSQPGVLYQLFDKALVSNKDAKALTEAYGDGSDLPMETPIVTQDIHYAVRAVKPSGLSLTLFQAIDIEAGLNTGLPATILDGEPLEPSGDVPDPAAPRIVAYGARPKVEVRASQAGVDYRLVCVLADPHGADYRTEDPAHDGKSVGVQFISDAVRGDSSAITLQAKAVDEDIDIRILAVRIFGDSEKSSLLKAVLPLKVRPNPDLGVILAQSSVDYLAGSAAIIKKSQVSASYQIFARAIEDNELVRDGNAPSALVLPGMASLWLENPPNPTADAQPLGAAKLGDGGDLALGIDGFKEDTLIVVHAAKPWGQDRKPPLQLAQVAALLVRPGPYAEFPLRFKAKDEAVPTQGGFKKDAVYETLNGQPGVFYHVRLAGSEQDLGLPVYFHKTGKGIEGLAVEVDFVLAATPPEWDCPQDLAADARVSIRAVKAQTGLETVYECAVAALLGAG